jgi:hypothetical protein
MWKKGWQQKGVMLVVSVCWLAGEREVSQCWENVGEALMHPVTQHHITEDMNRLIVVSLAADMILSCTKKSCP